jgi:AraC-like DNA-binding protein
MTDAQSTVLVREEPSPTAQERVRAGRAELTSLIAQAVPEDGSAELLPGLWLARASAPTTVKHGLTPLAFCVIAQGAKELWLGERRYRYDPAHYLITAESLPVGSRITKASLDEPYFGMVLRLDPAAVGSVMLEAGRPAPRAKATATAIDVSPLDAGLLDAAVRLARLIDAPDDARVLASLVTREIVYRLMVGAQGDRLHYLATLGAPAPPVARAIARLRRDFAKSLRMDELARELGMSTSAFHQHFKDVTALSPLQFQKQLRLQEARRLMLGEQMDAASAGYRVGYDDPGYFSRDYKRLFGEPPVRDVQRLRGAVIESAGL